MQGGDNGIEQKVDFVSQEDKNKKFENGSPKCNIKKEN